MTFQLIRLIFKELRILSRREPNIAARLNSCLRIHIDIYRRTRPLLSNRVKLQNDDELSKAFLQCLREANIKNTYNSFRMRVKLVEIHLQVSPFVDGNCFLKRGKLSNQMSYLESYKEFKKLPTDKDRQFVRGVIKKLLTGEEKYTYNNLSQFFRDLKYDSQLIDLTDLNCNREKNLDILQPTARDYVLRTIRGETQGVSEDYREVYRHMFSSDARTPFEKVMSSYLKSRYVPLDFQNIELIQ